MRGKIFDIIETGNEYKKENRAYTICMSIVIVISLIPLAYKTETPFFLFIDKCSVVIFIIDYVLRLLTADIKYGQPGALSFIRYPFSAMAICDLLSILPSLSIINKAFRTLRVFRMAKLTKIFRTTKTIKAFKIVRYSKSANILGEVIRKSKESLILLFALSVGYVLVSALIIFNVEPQTFDTFFDALYWATISLTTMGYGDIYATSTIGKIVTMLSSFVGIGIVALPSGIITAGFVNELNKRNEGE